MNGDHNASGITKLIVELRDIIVGIYSIRESQFAELISIKFEETYKFDYQVDAVGKTPPERMLYTIKWFHGDAGLDGLLDLAAAVYEAKPRRKDLEPLIEAIRSRIGTSRPTGSAGGGAPSAPGPTALPPDPAESLAKFHQQLTTMAEFARDLRQSLRAKDYRSLDLPGRYHLSESDGERSAAILALEAYHDPAYRRWLAERVTVEPPHASFLAGQALIAAALRSGRAELPGLLKVVKSARDQLDALDKSQDSERADKDYDISTRKDNLTAAETLIEMRFTAVRGRITHEDLDAYLGELLGAFDLDAFQRVFKNRVETTLDTFVSLTDPFELIVVGVIIRGRSTELGPKLMRAVYAEKPDNPTFRDICLRYARAPVPFAGRGR